MLEERTQVVPNQSVQLLRRHKPRLAAYIVTALNRVGLAPADIIVVVGRDEPTVRLQVAVATADQSAEQILVARAAA
jgi:hypothetical protein